MALPFKFGVRGRVGTGSQYKSWNHLDDEVGAIIHCIMNAAIRGPVNLVAPSPVTNLEFSQTLARVLSRPAVFPLPAFAAKLAMGEMAEALLLSSQRVEPVKLRLTGYPFRHTSLQEALGSIYNKKNA
jgi:NAD dependent epimerase/dehydratase family enzyme